MAELMWVLRQSYGVSRQGVLEIVEGMLETAETVTFDRRTAAPPGAKLLTASTQV